MTRWWIIDYRSPESWQDSSEWLATMDCRMQGEQPEHLLLLGCESQAALDVRQRLSARDSSPVIHTLLKPYLEAFNDAPEKWLRLCIHRLLQKHAAVSVEIYPVQQAPGRKGLTPDNLLRSYHSPGPGTGDQKPPLAFVSPLPPSKTGIAAYSEALLAHLCPYYELTLVVEDQPPVLPLALQHLPWLTARDFANNADHFERIVYQIGNSRYHVWQFDLIRRHPGLVVMHDYYLYDALWHQENAGIKPLALRAGLYNDHGYPAVVALDAADQGRGPEHYPVSGAIVNEAAGIVVHSRHARHLHRYWCPAHRNPDVHVIPHLRGVPCKMDRTAARRSLHINNDTLVIASFGIMNPKKGVDQIVAAFLNADFDPSQTVMLVFAGSGHTGELGTETHRMLNGHPRRHFVKFTGYLPADEYSTWLRAADIAVQLRIMTRGENSGAVLDVMAHGLPLITNAHGSNAELPLSAVYMLPEDPSGALLRDALVALAASPDMRMTLGQNARSWIRRHHDPDTVARLYHHAIEKSLDHPVIHQKQWLDRMAASAQDFNPSQSTLHHVSASIQQLQLLHQKPQPRLLIDVSTIARHDLKTGVERVTREMAIQLLKNPPPGFRSELICWQDNDFYLAVGYAARLLNLAAAPARDRPVEACANDIYLSFEWAPPLLLKASGRFLQMKALGVRFCFTVHDLLPMSLPACFPAGTEEKMCGWFQHIAHLADGLLCVSAHVAKTVNGELDRLSLPCRPGVGWFHPGADFSRPKDTTLGFREKRLLGKIDASPRPRILMVGTIEPRKGHQQMLAAAERLWGKNQPVTVIFAGKEGWEVQSLAAHLKKHPRKNQRLFWCNGGSDALLEQLYRRSDLLVAPSLDEGFGLPLIEAAHYQLPVLARDIPVFREVAGVYARYFSALDGTGLAKEIAAWIKDWQAGKAQPASLMPYNSWADSAAQLKAALFQSLLVPTRKGENPHEKDNPSRSRASSRPGKTIL